jgi:two-component system phosphate regulon response regulator PhoB
MKMLESFESGPDKHTIFVAQSGARRGPLFDATEEPDHYEVQSSEDAAAALLTLARVRPHLLVLDTKIARINWVEFYNLVRRDPVLGSVSILIVAERIEKVGQLTDFGGPNTDFIIEPFAQPELRLRVRRLLQRQQIPVGEGDSTVINYEDLRLDVSRHETVVQGHAVKLTPTEFKLLTTLAHRRGRVQTRDRLLRDVCDYNVSSLETRTIDTHMRRLRNKLGSAGWHLETIRGVGYRFRETTREP